MNKEDLISLAINALPKHTVPREYKEYIYKTYGEVVSLSDILKGFARFMFESTTGGRTLDQISIYNATNSDCKEELYDLSKHGSPAVRMAVASNPNHDPLWWLNDAKMIYFYYNLNDKQPLPEELHNSMIALSICGGHEDANRYINEHDMA